MRVRPVIFHPAARDVIRGFPREVRDRLGRYLYELQLGKSLSMPHSRPMPSVGVGVSELRINGMGGTYRVFYVTGFLDGVLVFHAFAKKSPQTPGSEISLAAKRLRGLLDA
jgi:phage-related protein